MPEPHRNDASNDGVILTVAEVAQLLNLKATTVSGEIEYHGANPTGEGASEDGFWINEDGTGYDRKLDRHYTSWDVAKMAGIEHAQYEPCVAYMNEHPNGNGNRSNGRVLKMPNTKPPRAATPKAIQNFDTRDLKERGIKPETLFHFAVATVKDAELGTYWKYPTFHPDGTKGKWRVKYRDPAAWVTSGKSDKAKKYIWLPDKELSEPVGYNIDGIENETEVWILNGEPAVWLAYQARIPAVSMFGEGRKFAELLQALKERGVTTVHVLPDFDETGVTIARQSMQLAADLDLDCFVHLWDKYSPLGYDFADFYETAGAEAKERLSALDKASSVLEGVDESAIDRFEQAIKRAKGTEPEPPNPNDMPDPTRTHKGATPKPPKGEKADVGAPAQASRLLELVEDYTVFKTEDDEACCVFEWQGRMTTALIDSDLFLFKLHQLYREYYLGWLDEKATKLIQRHMSALAEANPDRRPSFYRLGHHDEKIYLDLADADGNVVEIGPGSWRIIQNPDNIYFRRTADTRPMPIPVHQSAEERAVAWQEFADLIWAGREPANPHDFLLLVAWLVSAMRPAYTDPARPYVALAVSGAQNSGKTQTTKMLRALIDPSRLSLPDIPVDDQNLAIQAKWSHVLGYGNLSGIPKWCSDAFCRIVEDGAFAIRAHYENDKMKTFQASRPLLLNGIDDFMGRPDFKRRCIFVTMPPFDNEEEMLDEPEIWERFTNLHPRLLGALCDAVATGLERHHEVGKVNAAGGLVAFARWILACEPALPWTTGTFLSAYVENRQEASESTVENDLLARSIVLLANRYGTVHYKTADLHAKLTRLAAESMIGEEELDEMVLEDGKTPDTYRRAEKIREKAAALEKSKLWPPSNIISKDIKRLEENLRQVGITLKHIQAGAGRGWTIGLKKHEEEEERDAGKDKPLATWTTAERKAMGARNAIDDEDDAEAGYDPLSGLVFDDE